MSSRCMQEADVYLLDDVLAAVDPKVAQWLLQHAISGSMMQGRTLILCTHAAAALPFADLVWRLESGSLISCSPATKTESASGVTHTPGNEASTGPSPEQGPKDGLPGTLPNRQGALFTCCLLGFAGCEAPSSHVGGSDTMPHMKAAVSVASELSSTQFGCMQNWACCS